MILDILKYPDKRLRTVAKEVEVGTPLLQTNPFHVVELPPTPMIIALEATKHVAVSSIT